MEVGLAFLPRTGERKVSYWEELPDKEAVKCCNVLLKMVENFLIGKRKL